MQNYNVQLKNSNFTMFNFTFNWWLKMDEKSVELPLIDVNLRWEAQEFVQKVA